MQEGQEKSTRPRRKCRPRKRLIEENFSFRISSKYVRTKLKWRQLTRRLKLRSSNIIPASTSAIPTYLDSSKKENENPASSKVFSFEKNIKGSSMEAQEECFMPKRMTDETTSLFQSSVNVTSHSNDSGSQLTRCQGNLSSNTTPDSTSSSPSACLDFSKKENKNSVGSEIYSFGMDLKGQKNPKVALVKCFTQTRMTNENSSLQSPTTVTSHSNRSGLQSTSGKEPYSSNTTTDSDSAYSTGFNSSNKTSKNPMGNEVSSFGATRCKEPCSSNTTIVSASEYSIDSNSSNKQNKNIMGSKVSAIAVDKKGKPREWTVEEVIAFISTADSGLARLADIFRTHEIDGWAFSLLTPEVMMKYMGVKLGPAIKICRLVDDIKYRRHSKFDHKRKL